MSFLERMEQACAAFIERTFAKTFPSDLEPAQIARKVVATMEARTRGEEGQLFAPGSYIVYVNPEDFERLAEYQAYLEREWVELLRDLAGRVGIRFSEGDPSVEMTPRESVPAGAVDVAVVDEATVTIDAAVARRLPRRYHLRMIKGVPAYGVYYVEGRARIGRSEESEIFLVDPSVSRTHAVVEVDGTEPIVRDLGSTNGTFVNGERIEARPLRDGDELMFGNTRMRF
ncbi:MAG TPA: FhaA domain-containing protein, partial [Candidatus Baltobacteraceae bacterium]|nr:FhaA domain-containing protein [Candidatus Baltobacteraceae bacterium]